MPLQEIDVLDPYWKLWKPASGHPSGWRVVRGYSPLEEICGKTGRVILFKSMATAQKRADKLNGVIPAKKLKPFGINLLPPVK